MDYLSNLLLTVFLLLFCPLTAFSATDNAFEIIRESDRQMRGDSSYSEITMNIIRPTWTRSMSMKSWTKGMDLSLVLVTAPAKDKGSSSLKRYKEMWNWIPAIERVIKIAPSMLSQSWMGSDFTNDDLINESSIVVDYSHTLVGDEVIEDAPCWVIDAFAKPDAPVVWSRVRLWISKVTYLQRKVAFYDEFEELINTMLTYDVKELGGRKLAARMVMIPADKPGNKTELITHQAQFNFVIDDDFFSLKQMQLLRH